MQNCSRRRLLVIPHPKSSQGLCCFLGFYSKIVIAFIWEENLLSQLCFVGLGWLSFSFLYTVGCVLFILFTLGSA